MYHTQKTFSLFCSGGNILRQLRDEIGAVFGHRKLLHAVLPRWNFFPIKWLHGKGSLFSKRFIQIIEFLVHFSSKFLVANHNSGFEFKSFTPAYHKLLIEIYRKNGRKFGLSVYLDKHFWEKATFNGFDIACPSVQSLGLGTHPYTCFLRLIQTQ